MRYWGITITLFYIVVVVLLATFLIRRPLRGERASAGGDQVARMAVFPPINQETYHNHMFLRDHEERRAQG